MALGVHPLQPQRPGYEELIDIGNVALRAAWDELPERRRG